MMVDATPNPPAELRQMAVQLTLGLDRAGAGTSPAEVLARCVVLGTRSRAGFSPTNAPTATGVCPEESRPECSEPAAAILHQLLQLPDADTLLEWCQLADRASLRVPDRLVPPLLEWWTRQRDRSPAVFNCLGARGPWLAALNPAWATPPEHAELSLNAAERWQSGSTSERLAILQAVRAKQPEDAADLLRSTWETDNAAERTRFLEALRIGLQTSDEAFLEPLLDDRSKTVRRTAASLLRILPGSALRARMNDRLRSMLQTETRKGLVKRGTRLSIKPPAQFDPGWERDGIEEKPPTGIGQRAWWARQIIANADLSVWTSTLDGSPEGVLHALRDDDFSKDAAEALLLAAQSRPDPAWSAVLAHAELDSKQPRLNLVAPLWQRLQATAAESVLTRLMVENMVRTDLKLTVLATADWAWSPSFTAGSLQSVLADKHRPMASFDYATADALSVIARRADPSSLPLFERLVHAHFPGTPESVTRTLDRMRVRAEIHKEFRP